MRQQEKLAALGTLSAGLAHELNNPAAAARRTATELGEALDNAPEHDPPLRRRAASSASDAARLVELQQAALRAGLATATARWRPPTARTGWPRSWTTGRRRAGGWPSRWRGACLDDGLAGAGADGRRRGAPVAALEWVAASLTAHTLVGELHESTGAHLGARGGDQGLHPHGPGAVEDVDVHDGIDSTLTMLGSGIKHEPVTVERQLRPHAAARHGARLGAEPGVDEPADERARRAATARARSRSRPARSPAMSSSRSQTTGRGSPPTCSRASSSRSSPPSRSARAPGSASTSPAGS